VFLKSVQASAIVAMLVFIVIVVVVVRRLEVYFFRFYEVIVRNSFLIWQATILLSEA